MAISGRDVALGGLVFVLIVGLLVGGTAALGTLAVIVSPSDDTEPRGYDVDDLHIEQLPAEGDVPVPTAEPGVVVIDRAHGNAIDDGELRELTRTLVLAGHDVRVVTSPGEFGEALDGANALVVVDPQQAYSGATVDVVESFVDDGGHLLLMGQPNRMAIEEFALIERNSEIDSVANRFGISFGEDHVYDMQANDGNHRNIQTMSTDHALVSDVDTAVFYTATHVAAAEGEPILVSAETTARAKTGAQDEYVLGTVSGNVMAIGDVDFLVGERYNVADNNELIGAIVAFLGEGEEVEGEFDDGEPVEDVPDDEPPEDPAPDDESPPPG